MKISAAQFKARCLSIMDQVNQTHEEVIVTKHGRPVVKIVPVSKEPTRDLFGFMKGTATINGDIVDSFDESWDADR